MRYYFLIICTLLFLTGCNTQKCVDNEALAQNKKVAMINVQLGIAYLENGDNQRAKQKLLYALQKDPNLPEAWYSLGHLLDKTEHKQEAHQSFLKAVALAPNRGDVQNNYGTFLCGSGAYEESIEHFLAATKDPQYLDLAGAYENAGLCSLKIPDVKQAKQFFTLALDQDPTRLVAMSELRKLS